MSKADCIYITQTYVPYIHIIYGVGRSLGRITDMSQYGINWSCTKFAAFEQIRVSASQEKKSSTRMTLCHV